MRNSFLYRQARLFLAVLVSLLLLATRDSAVAQGALPDASAGNGDLNLPRSDAIYETNYRSNTIQVFSLTGADLGVFGMTVYPTGLTFDNVGNLYVSRDDPGNYAIEKFTPHGSVSIFANRGLSAPHALVFDKAGNLYVANAGNRTIVKFTPAGVGTVFADAADGLEHPLDLAFDAAGNLYVTNAFGGPTHTGSVVKFTPDGVGSIFADSGFQLAYGLAIDSAGNIYVSNFNSSTIEKFSSTGTDLGVFASAGVNLPHGMIFDRAGNLYVANNGNASIEKFSPTGVDLGLFASTGLGPHFLAMFRSSHR